MLIDDTDAEGVFLSRTTTPEKVVVALRSGADTMAAFDANTIHAQSVSYSVPGQIGVPPQERLTLQREANDLAESLARCHAMLDMLTGAPATPSTSNAAQVPLSTAVSNARSEANRLSERIDGLLTAIGQI